MPLRARVHHPTPQTKSGSLMKSSENRNLAEAIRRTLPFAGAILAGTGVAQAQQTEEVGLEEVVVSAQKRTESLQDVPLSIQAIGQEQLSELKVDDFGDYVKFLPNVSYQSFGPGFRASLHARRGQRRERQPLGSAAVGGRVSRRAAHHHHPGPARRADLRRRACRSARRTAGHAVRRQLTGRHHPHHHQQAAGG